MLNLPTDLNIYNNLWLNLKFLGVQLMLADYFSFDLIGDYFVLINAKKYFVQQSW